MTSFQKQDFVLFNDNSVLPERYFESGSLGVTKIGHVQGTSPAWLVGSLIENALVGSCQSINRDLTRNPQLDRAVVLVSFVHPKEFYTKICKRAGLDLDSESSFHFVDCFSSLFQDLIPDPEHPSSSISALWKNKVCKVIDALSTKKVVVFIEGTEILLHATNIGVNELLAHMFHAASSASQLNVVTAQDAEMLAEPSASIGGPGDKISDFLVKLTHRSQCQLSLAPLATGRADDISGTLTIARGSLPFSASMPLLIEREYIYHVSKDLVVNLFFR